MCISDIVLCSIKFKFRSKNYKSWIPTVHLENTSKAWLSQQVYQIKHDEVCSSSLYSSIKENEAQNLCRLQLKMQSFRKQLKVF